jgi:hypothetical protein
MAVKKQRKLSPRERRQRFEELSLSWRIGIMVDDAFDASQRDTTLPMDASRPKSHEIGRLRQHS